MKKQYKVEIDGKELIFNLGEMAKQANGSVFVNFGNSDFLLTVVKSKLDEIKDFFPLIINYEEKLYSIGKIPGNYVRREGRPTDHATICARLIDRPLRPLFPDTFDYEVQVAVTILGYDKDFECEMHAITAASLGSVVAGLPLKKLVAGLTIALIDSKFVIDPTLEERNLAKAILKVAGHKEALNMIEFEGEEIEEEVVLEMLMFAHENIKKLIKFQEEILKDMEVQLLDYKEEKLTSKQVYLDIKSKFEDEILNILKNTQDRTLRSSKLKDLSLKIASTLECEVDLEFDKIYKELFVKLIVEDKYRLDGRKIDEIRDLSSRIDVIKMAHGSALFTRGQTQALSTCTLGVKSDEQIFDGLEDYDNKRFFLHYNFPPYSVGETGRFGSPGRREIGHGTLAEKSFLPVLPEFEAFPYTIRIVSEILESNGSSSQATICAATMALQDAGVPIKRPVAGIAMGLIKQEDNFTILTDIAGLEDHLGDMDFKVAGTNLGITAIQMDMKISGIDENILKECLEKAKLGRLEILKHMEKTISKPKDNVKEGVLKIKQMKVKPSKIKDIIGRGGEMINKIIEQADVKIDIDDDGSVNIYGVQSQGIQKAQDMIEKIVKEYEVGQKYIAKVIRIEKYGAFVKFDDNQDALLHISDMAKDRVKSVEDKVSIGDDIKIQIIAVEKNNKIKVKIDED